MKKIAVVLAIVAVAALAAPAFSASYTGARIVFADGNDMSEEAYNAVMYLAERRILGGYPDGNFRGKQNLSRYELAYALQRAVDHLERYSKQDLEMLKTLVLQFKDELDALGVRVDELDERLAVFENRLGGWHIHGALVLDVKNRSGENAFSKNGDGEIQFDNARLFFERTFGENDEYFFRARLRNDGNGNMGNATSNSAYFDRYYVTMPFFMDSRLTVGRFLFDVDTAYRPSVAETGSWTGGDSVLTDTSELGFALEKNFGMGKFLAYASHTNRIPDGGDLDADKGTYTSKFDGINKQAWTIFAMGQLQFTESIGFDIGGQAFIGDNSSTPPYKNASAKEPDRYNLMNYAGDKNFKDLWTIFAGLRFNFNDAIAIKGAFYHQKADAESVQNDAAGIPGWRDYGYGINKGTDANPDYVDDANHWRAIIDVKQEALKFTSLWLEYGQYQQGFFTPQGMSTIFPSESSVLKPFVGGGAQAQYDINYWRVVLGQEWNEKWATHLFYYGYSVSDANGADDDAKPTEYGLGVQYKLNDATTMGLNYVHVDSDLKATTNEDETEDNIIRFRTSISF